MYKLLLMLACCFLFQYAHAQQKTTPYDFPVKPGTEEWKKLRSGAEMADACRIPVAVLSSLTTDALAQTCLNYPLLNEVLYAGNLQKGIEAVSQSFNGLSELLSRKDAATVLLGIYINKNAAGLDAKTTPEEQGAFTFEFTYLELLLAQPQIITRLNSSEKTVLAKQSIVQYESKKQRKDVFGEFGLTTCAFVLAKILQAENKLAAVIKTVGQEEVNAFLATALYSSPAIITAIVETAKTL